MSGSINITEADVFTIIRAFMVAYIPGAGATPPTVEFVRGLQNRVAEPTSSDFVVITPLSRVRLATNLESYNDQVTTGYKLSTQPTQWNVQLDFHGPNGADNSQLFVTLWRDDVGVSFFDNYTAPIDAEPLYCEDPRQLAFVNGEQQFEERWTVDAALQVNPIVTTDQQFAASLSATIIDVDVAYPP